ncbi:unnamed protein product [Agarophyton chilense]
MPDTVVATDTSALTDPTRAPDDHVPSSALLTEEAAKEALAASVATPNVPDSDGPAPSHVPDAPHVSDQMHPPPDHGAHEVGQTAADNHPHHHHHQHHQHHPHHENGAPDGQQPPQQHMADMSAAAAADVQTTESMHMSVNPMVPVNMPSVSMPVSMQNVSLPNVSMSLPANMPPVNMPAVQAVPDQQHSLVKDDDPVMARQNDETPLVEVAEAMMAANEVFNRVKSEKIAEQALCSIRNDQAQYEGLAKEIVGKAIKQKERERANRASAAASRAKVLRYQTELESRLNRMEAERNAYRKELSEIRNSHHIDTGRKITADESKQLAKLQDWIRKMEAANPQFVRSIIAQQEMEKLLGEESLGDRLDLDDKMDDEHVAKRRRTALITETFGPC